MILNTSSLFSFNTNASFNISNFFVDSIYSSNVYLSSSFFKSFFLFFFSFKYYVINDFFLNFSNLSKLFIVLWYNSFTNSLLFSYTLDLFFKLQFIFFYSDYYFSLFGFNKYFFFFKEPDIIVFYKSFFFDSLFPYFTYNFTTFEFFGYFFNINFFFKKLIDTFFNLYVFIFFFIILFSFFPLSGKKKIYSVFQLYFDFIIIIPSLIDLSLEDFLFIFVIFKVVLIYFVLSLFFLNKPSFTFFNYITLPFIFIIFGFLLFFVFIKNLTNLFIFGPTVYTGINFSKFNQSLLFSLLWDYILVLLMFFRFSVVLARLILVWLGFILVEYFAYFFILPLSDEFFSKSFFLWKNNDNIYLNILNNQFFDFAGEYYLYFFITCFFYFCKLLLAALQLFLFLLFGFFLTAMFTGYIDIEHQTSYFKTKFCNFN